MKVAAFFALAIGGLLAPLAALVVALLLSPFPYERFGPGPVEPPPAAAELAHQFAPGAMAIPLTAVGGRACTAGFRGAWPDGTAVGVAAFRSADAAGEAVEALLARGDFQLTSRTNALRYSEGSGRRADGTPVQVLAWTEGSWLLWIEAPDAVAFEARLRTLPFLRSRAAKPLADRCLGDLFPLALIGYFGWLVVLVPAWTRTASWAAVIRPPPGVAPVDAAELRRRLLALRHPDHPYAIREEGAFLIAEWNVVDRRWLEILSAGGARIVHRIRLRVDADDRTVRTQDCEGSLRWTTGGLLSAPEISWTVSRGITFFEYQYAAHPAFTVENGRIRFSPAATWSFRLSEMKNPLVQIVTQSGWTYRPVLSFLSRALFG